MTMALQSGEIDAAYGLPYVSYPLFETGDYTFTGCATSRVFFGAMNYESEITSDPAVRKAIAMGIDKEGFVETLLGGNGYPAVGVYPDTFSLEGDRVTAETYDPEGAAQVLEEAGWTDTDGDGVREKDVRPLVLRWLTYPSRQEQPLLAESAQATLGAIGFQVEINNTADHNRIRADRSAWDIYVSAMVTAPTGDPEYFLPTIVWMTRRKMTGGITMTIWNNWRMRCPGPLMRDAENSWRWRCSRRSSMIMPTCSVRICR